jgi:hypothetical protein
MIGARESEVSFGRPKSLSNFVCYFFNLFAFFSYFSCSSFCFSASDIPLAAISTSSLVTLTGSSILTSSTGAAGVAIAFGGVAIAFGGAAALIGTGLISYIGSMNSDLGCITS